MNIHFTESFINNNERVLDIDVGEAGVTFEDCPAVGLEPLRVEIYKRQTKPKQVRAARLGRGKEDASRRAARCVRGCLIIYLSAANESAKKRHG